MLGDEQQRSVRETDEMCAENFSVTKYKHDHVKRVHKTDLPVEVGYLIIQWKLLI
jgi:hypothetical protein